MQLIVWLAVMVFATPNGGHTEVSDPLKDESDCKALLAKADALVDQHPEVLMLGQSCVKVTVVEVVPKPQVGPKMSTPKANALGDNGVRTL